MKFEITPRVAITLIVGTVICLLAYWGIDPEKIAAILASWKLHHATSL